MRNTSKSQVYKVQPDTVITGKWHNKSYRIVKPLGNGANGIVYLAEGNDGLVALKISENSLSITSEVNVLKHFSKVQGAALGPYLLDVDDWVLVGNTNPIPFYVMEYIKGETFLSFVERRGKEWTGVLCLQLLSDLERLHQEGWVFGDLKPENLMVTGNPPKIRCIDVGGTTLKGRSIKEFTEFFDRGYWGAGSRKAEASYDLFAVAMVIINSAFPKRFSKSDSQNGKEQLKQVIEANLILKRYERILLNAIDGNYLTAADMRKELVDVISNKTASSVTSHRKNQAQRSVSSSNQSKKQYNNTRVNRKKAKSGGFFETVLILTTVLLGYIIYIYGQLL